MPANQVRIIGGRHRGRRLSFIPGRGLRPTPDRARETLFNWLQAEIQGSRCLDLFAGSGALGLEAVSRGCSFLCAMEQNRASAQRLRDNVSLLHEEASVEVLQGDALRLLRSPPQLPFDIALLDPPFADGLMPGACAALEANAWLAADALIYLEQDAHRAWPTLPGNWQLHREGTAGQSAHRLLRRSIPR